MIIEDPQAAKLIARADSETLCEYIRAYCDPEHKQVSDELAVVVAMNELVWKFEAEGTVQHENLVFSKKVLKETDNGKSLTPDYTAQDVADAKATVNEYKRLKRLLKEWQDESRVESNIGHDEPDQRREA